MTVTHWNTLIGALKGYDLSRYDGVILLHGTDTLAYTASLLSLLMAGTPIPVILVSAQLPIEQEGTNANVNFQTAVELICRGIAPNVYAVYRNSDGVTYLHYGAHLLQCANRSDDFYSADRMPIVNGEGFPKGARGAGEMLLFDARFEKITSIVLRNEPYVGIDYSRFCLDGVDAILHGVYHSCTAPTNPYPEGNETSPHSILSLKRACDARGIDLLLAPCERATYESTGIALEHGIMPICEMTSEMSYVKTLVGCSMGLRGEALLRFLEEEINGEFVYP